jgi:hypothetical protein
VITKIERDNDDIKKKKKYHIPETFYFKEARALFKEPDVDRDIEKIKALIKWDKPEEEQLKDFLVNHKGFSE